LIVKGFNVDFNKKIVAIWTRKRQGETLERDIMQMNRIFENVLQRKFKTKDSEFDKNNTVPMERKSKKRKIVLALYLAL